MGQLQVTQIKRRLEDTLVSLLDVSDLAAHAADQLATNRLSRALAAFVLMKLGGLDEVAAARAVTDGSRDNGIDAIATFPDEAKVIVVQSKWSAQGKGSAALDEMLKLREGVNDLVQFKWDNFNDKVKARSEELEAILLQSKVSLQVVFAHNGPAPLAEDVRRRIDEYIDDLNDPSETASFSYFGQSEIHKLLIDEQQSPRIDLSVVLSDWGQIDATPRAIYGQVNASEVANWYNEHGSLLLAKNVRVVLPDSEVNNSLAATLTARPELFWYFNNGITVLCEEIAKAPAGGADRRLGTFSFRGVSVVNGAQTVGAVARVGGRDLKGLSGARVMVRFIALAGAEENFANDVTRATNTQNRIGGRDFLSLDPQQARLRDEFAVDGLIYVYRSGENEPPAASGCSVFEATVGLACASANSSLAVQAKREISRLWDDTSKAPYRTLFNSGTTYLRVWRSVVVLRKVQAIFDEISQGLDGKRRGIVIHGNRLLLHLVFERLQLSKIDDPEFNWETETDRVNLLVDAIFRSVSKIVENDYPGYLASLFKNSSKCSELVKKVKDDLVDSNGHPPS